jgi:hypothetical protein
MTQPIEVDKPPMRKIFLRKLKPLSAKAAKSSAHAEQIRTILYSFF